MADPPVLEVAKEQLHVSESEKLLGIHLDNAMSCTSHVEAIINQRSTGPVSPTWVPRIC